MIVIPDGAADYPVDELDGLTPLQAAATPHLDRLARSGRVGTVSTTPPGFGAGSDVCSMCLLGYDPARYHTGRAPLEAAAMGLETAPGDWICRVNLVSVSGEPGDDSGQMLDHSGGGIPSEEARVLLEDLAAFWSAEAPDLMAGLRVIHGVEYRGVAIDSSGREYAQVETVPPHEIPGEPWAEHLPDGGSGDAAERLCALMSLSHGFLADHAINRHRVEQGLRPANMAWVWGQGTAAELPAFGEVYGFRGAMTTAVDLLRGISNLMGWDLLDVPGATGTHDNDYAGQGRATIEAVADYDVVCCHVESPDEAAHQADWQTKVAAIESIDAEVIGPILEHLEQTYGDPERDPEAEGWRLMVLPDHYTRCDTRKHDATPVPFAIGGAWVRSVVERTLTEADANESDLHIDPGHELMEYFLRSGMRGD